MCIRLISEFLKEKKKKKKNKKKELIKFTSDSNVKMDPFLTMHRYSPNDRHQKKKFTANYVHNVM